MSRHFLITAFPPTPESCRQALALPSTTRTRHIRLRVCLSLLLCAVLLGGIAYTVGSVLYGLGKRKKWMHSIFHIFVDLGALLQFFCVLFYAI